MIHQNRYRLIGLVEIFRAQIGRYRPLLDRLEMEAALW